MVVHPASPRIEALTVEFAREGILRRVVHPFYSPSWLHDTLQHAPAFVDPLRVQLTRRRPPTELQHVEIVQARIGELARVTLFNLDKRLRGRLRNFEESYMYWYHRRLSSMAAKRLDDIAVIYARSGSAYAAFLQAKSLGLKTILDYPIAHHRYSRIAMADAAEQSPHFASTLQWSDWPKWLEQQLDVELELADVVHTGSRFAANTLVANGVPPVKIVTEPYGVNTDQFQPREGQLQVRPFRVVFIGQIGQRKGIRHLLEGYRRFKKPDSELTLVGNFVGDPAPVLKFSEDFTHVPHVPKWTIPSLLQQSSVFVFPSLNEGLGLAVLEAMACGLPIITTDRGPAEVVRHMNNGLVVPPGDSDSIAEALELLYSDPELQQELGKNARVSAETRSWAAYAARLQQQFVERGCWV
jgi:glycosyltransferase involved in cell wall biosynthesis